MLSYFNLALPPSPNEGPLRRSNRANTPGPPSEEPLVTMANAQEPPPPEATTTPVDELVTGVDDGNHDAPTTARSRKSKRKSRASTVAPTHDPSISEETPPPISGSGINDEPLEDPTPTRRHKGKRKPRAGRPAAHPQDNPEDDGADSVDGSPPPTTHRRAGSKKRRSAYQPATTTPDDHLASERSQIEGADSEHSSSAYNVQSWMPYASEFNDGDRAGLGFVVEDSRLAEDPLGDPVYQPPSYSQISTVRSGTSSPKRSKTSSRRHVLQDPAPVESQSPDIPTDPDIFSAPTTRHQAASKRRGRPPGKRVVPSETEHSSASPDSAPHPHKLRTLSAVRRKKTRQLERVNRELVQLIPDDPSTAPLTTANPQAAVRAAERDLLRFQALAVRPKYKSFDRLGGPPPQHVRRSTNIGHA
jgi:hypothetical protein